MNNGFSPYSSDPQTRKRLFLRPAEWVVAIIVTVLAIWVISQLHNVAKFSAPSNSTSSACVVNNSGYSLTLTNGTSAAEEVTGFVVTFNDSNGAEIGSDTEPGNYSVYDGNGVSFDIFTPSWIGAGQSQQYGVNDPVNMDAASCTLAAWYSS